MTFRGSVGKREANQGRLAVEVNASNGCIAIGGSRNLPSLNEGDRGAIDTPERHALGQGNAIC